MNTVARLGRGELLGKVRVGITVDSLDVEQWKADVIFSLLSEPVIQTSAIFLAGERAAEPKPRLLTLYEQWSARAGAPFRLVDLSAMLDEVPKIPLAGWLRGQLPPQTVAFIASQGLDVMLWLTSRCILDCRGLARRGVWSFALGTPRDARYAPPFIGEVIDREPLSQLLLVEHSSSLFEGRVLTRQVTPTRESWYITLNAVEATRNAGTMVVRRLLDLVSLPQRVELKESVTLPGESTTYPSTASLLRYVGRQAVRSTMARVRLRGRRAKWFVAARTRDRDTTSASDCFTADRFERVSTDIEEADPFVVEWRGKEALFVEEMLEASGRGRISCRLFEHGGFSKAVAVLDLPYHVSYPHMFVASDELFMIPETSAKRAVELYRCVEFPLRWELKKVLCEGVPLVDTTVLFHEGTWYFFTTALETGELLLFWAEALDGPWNYHPQNPIAMDVRRARSAGAFFTAGSKLIRPAQDCSVRYGYAIVLNEVLRLSRETYEEVTIQTILPAWQPGLLGTHTLNHDGHMQVIDGLELAR